MVTSPVDCGGLGIPDMERFARALPLRWLWLAWTDPGRPWVGTGTPCDNKDRALFASATRVEVGDGNRALFRHCSWLGEQPLRHAFPLLFSRSVRKNRTVAEALHGDRWVLDLRHGNTMEIIPQVVLLRHRIRWKPGSQYSARTAYNIPFPEELREQLRQLIWKIWAPGKIKFFLWLLHHDRLWCNDRL
ncbi:uncharacterized protein [Aegilops tauschii subsp. strangulata]|uniref:uncharacterized protein n=1 Tax=Aegilops tauschii subsp. strangulata TaxID=200361 RepID=UPI003CC8A600